MFLEDRNIFCTIITADYSHYALALHDSLLKQDEDSVLAVFVSKEEILDRYRKEFEKRNNIQLYFYPDLKDVGRTKDLFFKYSEDYHDAYRWGMKPIFINYLLQKFEKVIYLDSDLYFFNDSRFLFEQLNKCQILLTPHWRSIKPTVEYTNFVHNFRDGLYNGGFIGASRGAEPALSWWAEMILFKCEVDRRNGYYVDQRYLDLLPVHFDGVSLVKHKGCNVANWNKVECKRTRVNNGEVIINNEFPIIFIHFTNSMFAGIFYENDELLLPYLEVYRDNLLNYSSIDVMEEYVKKGRLKKSRSEADFVKQKPFINSKIQIAKGSKSLFKKIMKKLT